MPNIFEIGILVAEFREAIKRMETKLDYLQVTVAAYRNEVKELKYAQTNKECMVEDSEETF